MLIVASKNQLNSVVRELYHHNVFHIEDFTGEEGDGYEGFTIGAPLSGAADLSTKILRIRSLENTYGINPEKTDENGQQACTSLEARIDSELSSIEANVEAQNAEQNGIEVKIREYEQRLIELEPFITFPVNLSLLHGYENFSVLAGHIPKDVELPVDAETFFDTGVPGNLLVAIIAKSSLDEATTFLSEQGLRLIPIPDMDCIASERIAWFTQEITRLTAEKEQIDERIKAQREEHEAFLVACDELLTAEVEQMEAPLRFATTEKTFVAEGWIPSESVDKITSGLQTATGGKVYVEELEFDPVNDTVPIEYDNPNFSKPSEILMDTYSRPGYSELDPTIFLSIIFPIFFGFILGDVAYGLVLLAVSYGLRKVVKGEAGKKLLVVLRNLSISSIIFGLLFSEFLGFPLPWAPIGINRHLNIGTNSSGHAPDVVLLLVLSAWIGILHITLGRLIHIRNASVRFRNHKSHRNKVILGQTGWIFVMWGLLLIIWSIAAIPLMPDLTALPQIVSGFNVAGILGTVMLLTGVAGIAQDNILELTELPTVLSHVLSYTRLAAVGLSSVAIAMVTNYIAIGLIIEPALNDLSLIGIVVIVFGIVVFLLGHTLNTVLGLVGGGLHSIRLHYVEFFTKFYLGGGKKYNPFGMIRRFTEE